MAIFMQSTLPGVTSDQYDALNARLQSLPGNTFEGCLAHTCVATDSGLQIFDLWESEEAMNKFGTVMMPEAEKLNLPNATTQPEISQVHNYWIPGT